MSIPTASDLNQARRQRDGALTQARAARSEVKKALGDLVPAQKQANSGFKEWKGIHSVLTRKKLLGEKKGQRVRRGILALFLPEISKAYMLSWKRGPKAIKVINSVVGSLQGVKGDLDQTISKLQGINIPTGVTNVAALASIPSQVEQARNQALVVVDKATAMLSKCSQYKKDAVPFLKATLSLLQKVERLGTKRLDRLKDRKIKPIAKQERIKAYQKLVKKTARFQKKLGRAVSQINKFVQGCPADRRKLISARGEISAIMLPGMSPSPPAPTGSSNSAFGAAMSPREAVVAQLYAQSPHLHSSHYLG